ncbi:MAG: tubulin-like doman-containing protein [Sandaracinaceae bacterium]|nr:tubulin-like doman-containing protein [Sandaracinaceae bacterium]
MRPHGRGGRSGAVSGRCGGRVGSAQEARDADQDHAGRGDAHALRRARRLGGQAIGRIAKRLRAARDYSLKYERLVRFVAIDTNAADLAKLRQGYGSVGHVDSTITLSDFDKVEFAKLRRGETFADADPYFTQWVHPWYRFREESGAGAGQIRIESRLGFFRSVEVGELTRQLQDVLADLRSHQHGMRKQGAPLQVFVYFSVAGGTGSGAFLPFAYLLRDLIGDGSARLFGFAILPDAFEEVVGKNRDGTLANGYAALEELEHLSRLDTQVAGAKSITFHYDPRNKHKTAVDRRPFDLVYVVDRPADFSVDDVGEALADATYVQIFSPILGEQQGDYDNYTKESRAVFPPELGDEGYTAFYGTLGGALMLLPRRDLLRYCARRFAATAVRRYLLLDDPTLVSDAQRERFRQFNVDREELERLSPEARADRLDTAFALKLDMLADQDREGGHWHRLKTVRDTAPARLAEHTGRIEADLRASCAQIREISADRILDDAWTPAATMNALAREVAQAKSEVDARLGALLAQVESGDFLAELLAKAGPDAAPELSPTSSATCSCACGARAAPSRARRSTSSRARWRACAPRRTSGATAASAARWTRTPPRSSAPTAAGTSCSRARTRTSRPRASARWRPSTSTSTRAARSSSAARCTSSAWPSGAPPTPCAPASATSRAARGGWPPSSRRRRAGSSTTAARTPRPTSTCSTSRCSSTRAGASASGAGTTRIRSRRGPSRRTRPRCSPPCARRSGPSTTSRAA